MKITNNNDISGDRIDSGEAAERSKFSAAR
jgi:hypothetical protein